MNRIMSKIKEVVKQVLEEEIEPMEEELPDAVKEIKMGIDDRIEAETIGAEFLKELQPIVESRRKLKEAEEALAARISELKMVIEDLSSKFESFSELKLVNLNLERQVLTDIKKRLNSKQ